MYLKKNKKEPQKYFKLSIVLVQVAKLYFIPRLILQMSNKLMVTLKMKTFDIKQWNTDIRSVRPNKKPIILILSWKYINKIITYFIWKKKLFLSIETRDTQKQWTFFMPRLWFLMTISHLQEPELIEKWADFSARIGKM